MVTSRFTRTSVSGAAVADDEDDGVGVDEDPSATCKLTKAGIYVEM
jgi:hypothetical protein